MRPLIITSVPLDGTVCIEASAGTGKTYTIGLIVLRLVMEQGLEFKKLAVVTFAKSASGELALRLAEFLRTAREYAAAEIDPETKDPIRKIVNHSRTVVVDILNKKLLDTAKTKVINAAPESVNGDLDKDAKKILIANLDAALLNFDLARITTIHGFCSGILDEFAFETGSSFGMGMEESQDELIDQILEDFWRIEIGSLDLRLYKFVSELTPAKLRNELRELMAFPGLAAGSPLLDCATIRRCIQSLEALGIEWKKSRDEVVALLSVERRFKSTYCPATEEKIEEFVQKIDDCFTGAWPKFTSLKLLTHKKIDESLQQNARKSGFVVPALQLSTDAQQFIATYEKVNAALVPSLIALAHQYLVAELKVRLNARRQRSFNSMISDLADSLTAGGERVAAPIRNRFSAVLVDEFQDTDALQFKIFHQLFFAKEEVFFAMIGDPKQAIFRFRGGDIKTYIKARNDEKIADRVYTLSDNQRSERRLVHAINAIYTTIDEDLNPEGPFLTTDIEYHMVVPRKNLPSPKKGGSIVPPVTLWKFPDEGKPVARIVGKRIAKTITDLLDPLDPLVIRTDKDKPLQLRDIAILTSTNKTAVLMKDILAECGIRSVVGKSGSILQTKEAEELLLLMEAMLNPSKENTIRTLLNSSLYGYTLEALKEWETNDDLRIRRLNELYEGKNKWINDGIACTLNHLLSETGVFTVTDGAMQNLFLERRITNFRHCIEILHNEELVSGRLPERLLNSFLSMMAEANESNTDEARLQRLESDYDAVQIFTMHKAKGLQWPIVFAPELWRSGKFGNENPAPIFCDDDGTRKADFDPQHAGLILEKSLKEIREERMRLAYVTLTRAESLVFAVTANVSVHHKGKDPKPPEKDRTPSALLLRSPKLAGIGDESGALIAIQEFKAVEGRVELKSVPTPVVLRDVSTRESGPLFSDRWWIGSYSGLARGITHASSPDIAGREPDTSAPEGIFAFRKGPAAGTALHTIFEQIDFIDAGRMDAEAAAKIFPLVNGVLTDAGLTQKKSSPLSDEIDENVRLVMQMVQNVMRQEIFDKDFSFRLQSIPKEHRVTELEFYLTACYPGSGNTPVRAGDILKIIPPDTGTIRDPEPSIDGIAEGDSNASSPQGEGETPETENVAEWKTLQGFLTGSIDLVFHHEGKWFLLDWKSNHLGNSSACYSDSAMLNEMKKHNYHLQYHLYTVALIRYLNAMTGNTFNYGKNFGGVIYVFLRGVDGTGNGIFFRHPDESVIQAIEALL